MNEEPSRRLISEIAKHDRVVVAFSGGVDSAVVAAASYRALHAKALAVMSISPSVPRRQAELARGVAQEIGIAFETIETFETDRPQYQQNDSRRCFYCKETLYAAMAQVSNRFPDAAIMSGTNADDLGDYRPGIQAGDQAGVIAPLANLGIGKSQVRQIAKLWALSVHDLPAGPCLASRIAYGEPVTVPKLQMVDRAENWLRDQGFRELRVRLHPGLHARIEVPSNRLEDLMAGSLREPLAAEFRRIGFQFVSVDIEGFRSGNLNQLVTLDASKR